MRYQLGLFRSCGGFAASACGVLIGVTGAASGQEILAQSTFDADLEGWSIRTNNSNTGCDLTALVTRTPTWESSGGNPGGFIQAVDPAESRTAFWHAPAGFLGDQSSAYGGTLSYDLKQSATSSQYNEIDLVLEGGGIRLVFDTAYNPRTTWTHYDVPLETSVGWRVTTCDGPFATEAQIRQALGDVTMWLIRAEYRGGPDTDGLDNVVLAEDSGIEPELSDTFESGIGGWWIVADATPSWAPTEGNPGGCLRGDDFATGELYVFVAPTKYSGDRSGLVGSTLALDFRASPGADYQPQLSFVTLSNGVQTLSYVSPGPITGNVWRRHLIPLAPSPDWTRTSDNQPATLEDFQGVMSNLTSFMIRGEFRDGDEVEWLDNVFFGSCEPSATAAAGAPKVCGDGLATLHVTTGGLPPTSYLWMRDGEPLTDGPGVAGSQTATLLLSGVHAEQAGPYECVVVNDCDTVTSNAVLLNVCSVDLNCDGEVDLVDYFEFFNCFDQSQLCADVSGDGSVDLVDFFEFFNAFDGGC